MKINIFWIITGAWCFNFLFVGKWWPLANSTQAEMKHKRLSPCGLRFVMCLRRHHVKCALRCLLEISVLALVHWRQKWKEGWCHTLCFVLQDVFSLLYSVFILCVLPCCFCACMLASVLIGLSDEMLLRAVVITQYPNWHHSLSTSSPWREFDLSGVTTMCYHPAQSVI